MPSRDRFMPRPVIDRESVPFTTAEEAWFWFVQAQQARAEGAKIVAGLSSVSRPCEPVDIFRVMERLYRARRLLMDHVMVLRAYGRRQAPPDPRMYKEIRAHSLWTEAMERMEEVFITKGIVAPRSWFLPLDLAGHDRVV